MYLSYNNGNPNYFTTRNVNGKMPQELKNKGIECTTRLTRKSHLINHFCNFELFWQISDLLIPHHLHPAPPEPVLCSNPTVL